MPPKKTQQPANKKRGRPPTNKANCEADTERKTSTHAGRARRPDGVKPRLKQYVYYKYKSDVEIYHFQASFVSVQKFQSLLNREQHGYVDLLLGPDLLGDKSNADGDEMQEGCIEACYMLGVFQHGGSALGFRLEKDTVEWLCFDRDVRPIIIDKIDIETPTAKVLFDPVASVAKPEYINHSRKVPYTEHKDWFESLRLAEKRPLSLGLTWKNFGTEMRREHVRLREVHEGKQRAREKMTDPESSGASNSEESSDDGWDEEESNNFGDDEAQCQDEHLDEEHGQGIGGFENGRDMESMQRTTDSPMTVGRWTPVVYLDPSPAQGSELPPNIDTKHIRSSSSDSVLSDRSGNMLPTHHHSSVNLKGGDQHLTNGGYI